MTLLRKRLLTAIAALYVGAGSLAAHAQAPAPVPGAPMAPHEHGGDLAQMAARMKERMAKRQAELHDKLKLNAAQEAAWQTYVSKMQPPSMPQRTDRAEFERLSAPERMERALAHMKEHEQLMESRLAATREFYARLTPEQQKIFNDETAHGWGHRHGGRGGHPGR